MEYAQARRRLFPESGAEWMQHAGAYIIFDGVESPLTQTFGLGIFEEVSPASLETIEQFFHERGSPIFHEVSPFAGVAALKLLCERNYKPVEVSNVLCRSLNVVHNEAAPHVGVRLIAADEAQLWSETSARGWAHEHPELWNFLLGLGSVSAARERSLCFLAEFEGKPGAAGVLCIHEGVALLGGTATVPEMRRRGLHTAMLQERMRFALNHGCDVAMMVAQPGSDSQRNAERQGFQIAYTRTKWQLQS